MDIFSTVAIFKNKIVDGDTRRSYTPSATKTHLASCLSFSKDTWICLVMSEKGKKHVKKILDIKVLGTSLPA
jgi:hypothetical protein